MIDTKDMNLAETLIKARYKTGLNQRDVGKLIGKSGMAVCNSEKLDGAEVSKATLAMLCDIYHIDYAETSALHDAETIARREKRMVAKLERKKKAKK